MIDNTSDIIDSRDIIERIDELKKIMSDEIWNVEKDELEVLKDLAENCEDNLEWEYGITLIKDSYFVEYTEDLARDIGAVNDECVWPNNHIDWDEAAAELQMDYTCVDFNGVNYYYR